MSSYRFLAPQCVLASGSLRAGCARRQDGGASPGTGSPPVKPRWHGCGSFRQADPPGVRNCLRGRPDCLRDRTRRLLKSSKGQPFLPRFSARGRTSSRSRSYGKLPPANVTCSASRARFGRDYIADRNGVPKTGPARALGGGQQAWSSNGNRRKFTQTNNLPDADQSRSADCGPVDYEADEVY